MEYGHIPGVNKPISRLVQGTLGVSPANLDEGYALLDAIYAEGCNAFDTAHVYHKGENERIVGRWIRERGIRDQLVLIAKGAHHNEDRSRVTPFDIEADLHDSFARFGFDYIDIFLLHRDDPRVPVGPIVEILNQYQAAGHTQVTGNMVDFGMDPQEAIDAARFRHFNGTTVAIENLDAEGARRLEELGHELRDPVGVAFGGGQATMRLARGWAAASDPRKDGMAAGH